MLTTIYYIRHAEQLKLKGQTRTSESTQIKNEKIVLSVDGEKEAERLSKLKELRNVNKLWCSNYVRAICTAKYIAKENEIDINISEELGERKLGDLEALKKIGENKVHSYTTEQLIDKDLKTIDGESRRDVEERMYEATMNILETSEGDTIAVISHGAAIKFLLMKWCDLDKEFNIVYNKRVIAKEKLNSPDIFKLTFEDKKLINIEKIDF